MPSGDRNPCAIDLQHSLPRRSGNRRADDLRNHAPRHTADGSYTVRRSAGDLAGVPPPSAVIPHAILGPWSRHPSGEVMECNDITCQRDPTRWFSTAAMPGSEAPGTVADSLLEGGVSSEPVSGSAVPW